MTSVYTLYLNSNDLISGNKTSGTWCVDWKSFLPSPYKSYKITDLYFKTFNATDARITETLLIYSSLVSSNNNFNTTTKGKSQLLTIASPVNQYTYASATSGMTSYYESKTPYTFSIDYPPQNNITITINDSSNANFNSASLNNYVLVISFKAIE